MKFFETEQNTYVLTTSFLSLLQVRQFRNCPTGPSHPESQIPIHQKSPPHDFITRTLHVYAIALRSKDPLSAL